MAFNSESYYRNKWRRKAIAELAEAREIKANGHSWKTVESAVRYARSSWRLYLTQCRICELSREMRNANRPPHRHKAPYRPEPFTTRSRSDDE
jgi:hypothetical protein